MSRPGWGTEGDDGTRVGAPISRRRFLAVGAAVPLGVVAAACGAAGKAAPTVATSRYRSRPDLTPPSVRVQGPAGLPSSPGFVFVTPVGPLVVDDDGEPVWVGPTTESCANLRVQLLGGRHVLTWWEGRISDEGLARGGSCVVADDAYREIRRVRAAGGLETDFHELILTDRGTAYLTAWREVEADLSAAQGPTRGTMVDSVVQEVDLADGRVLFEWHSAEHVDVAESYRVYQEGSVFDPVRVTSVEPTGDGALLLSARNTWALYKVDAASGTVRWRLGGKRSDFAQGPGARFAWQHDARVHPGNVVSLFDDEAAPPEARQSRGLVLEVDEGARTSTLRRAYLHPGRPLRSADRGSVQVLPGGDVLVGWGTLPYFTEYRANGTPVLDGRLGGGQPCRTLRFPWRGRPRDRPAVAVERRSRRLVTAYASWNGATGVESWDVLAGPSPGRLAVAGSAPRLGFETPVDARTSDRYVAVRAMDSAGRPMRTSPVIVA